MNDMKMFATILTGSLVPVILDFQILTTKTNFKDVLNTSSALVLASHRGRIGIQQVSENLRYASI